MSSDLVGNFIFMTLELTSMYEKCNKSTELPSNLNGHLLHSWYKGLEWPLAVNIKNTAFWPCDTHSDRRSTYAITSLFRVAEQVRASSKQTACWAYPPSWWQIYLLFKKVAKILAGNTATPEDSMLHNKTAVALFLGNKPPYSHNSQIFITINSCILLEWISGSVRQEICNKWSLLQKSNCLLQSGES